MDLQHGKFRGEGLGRGNHTRLSSLGLTTCSSGDIVLEPEVGWDHSAPFPIGGDPDATIPYCLNPVTVIPGDLSVQPVRGMGARESASGSYFTLATERGARDRSRCETVNSDDQFTLSPQRGAYESACALVASLNEQVVNKRFRDSLSLSPVRGTNGRTVTLSSERGTSVTGARECSREVYEQDSAGVVMPVNSVWCSVVEVCVSQAYPTESRTLSEGCMTERMDADRRWAECEVVFSSRGLQPGSLSTPLEQMGMVGHSSIQSGREVSPSEWAVSPSAGVMLPRRVTILRRSGHEDPSIPGDSLYQDDHGNWQDDWMHDDPHRLIGAV